MCCWCLLGKEAEVEGGRGIEMLRIKIDGREYEVPEGITVLEAAKRNGIHIPTLCHHPALKDVGACRVCVVEVKGVLRLLTACTTPVSDGMEVFTKTKRVLEARKFVVELILSRHPLDCFSCERNGSCELQDLAYELGIEDSPYADRKRGSYYSIDDSSPFILRDLNKCILCGRCVRVCNGIQGDGVINFAFRGIDTKIATAFDRDLIDSPCVYCGQCVEVCPVGALIDKPSMGKGRSYELKKTKTICPYCGVGCEIEINVNVKTGMIAKVTTDYESKTSLNKGRSCVKGRFGWGFIQSPDRLKKPLVKENGKFKEVSFDYALDLVAKKLTEIKKKYGPDSIGILSSAKCTNEENYVMQKFARATIGTNNVDHCARLCHASTVVGLAKTLGSGAMTNDYDSILQSDVILITGSNTTEAHPVIATWIKEAVRNGTKLIVVDPRKIDMVKYATIWLRQYPGTDVAWINGMMHIIIEEGWYNKEFVEERTVGFERLRDVVRRYTPDYVERVTGIPAKDLKEAAYLYSHAKAAGIYFAMGITQHVSGTDNVISIANLALITGNLGRPGAGVNPLRGQNNVQGACDLGALPDVYPGYQKVDSESVRRKFEAAWGVKLSPKPGLTVVEMMDRAYEGTLKAMYIMAENPALSDPDINHLKESLKRLEFLVVQDIFLNETAELADVVLPAASFAEKDGTYTATPRVVQKLRKALDPPGEAMEDWKIVCEISARMGYPMNYASTSEVMKEIASVTPIYAGISHERLENGGIPWPCTSKEHPGTPILYTERFNHPDGKARIIPVEYKEPLELPDAEYPYLLSTGRWLQHFHTGTMTRRSGPINEYRPEIFFEINPNDGEKLGLRDGEIVRVTSRRGSIEGKVRLTDKSMPGMVFIPFHFSEAAVNLLTSSKFDPVAKIPEFKVSAVKIEKV